MKNFITVIKRISIGLIYILGWQVLSMWVGNKILIAGPYEVFEALVRIVNAEEFWGIIKNSLINIMTGFTLALLFSTVMAFAAFHAEYLRMLLSPAIHICKSVPVASFIILILIWTGSEGIASVISFIIAVPVIYSGTLRGFMDTDKKLLDMARIFRMKSYYKIYYIYFWQIRKRFGSDAALALGMCFKAGVAAEVIGVAKNTLGEQIYLSKIYLNTDELFAWTIVIMVLAFAMEKAVKLVLGGMEIIHERKKSCNKSQ